MSDAGTPERLPNRFHALQGSIGLLVMAVLVATGFFALLRVPATLAPDAPPAYTRVPEFHLTDDRGFSFGSRDLAGRPWLIDFIFTRCQGPCPVMTRRMEAFQKSLPPEVGLVSVSVDPRHDTPAVFAAYAAQYGADPSRWRFLTGDHQAIFDLIVDGFKLTVRETPEDPENPILHDIRILLVDREGNVRAYDSTDPAVMALLQRDAAKLAEPTGFGRHSLPAVNASLNATAAILLLLGVAFIRKRHPTAHAACMFAAMWVSTAFLVTYLVYHLQAGSVHFPGVGTVRLFYLSVLLTHTVLATLVPVLAIRTAWLGLRERWSDHRRWAKVTLPVWLYVSVTGVLIYVMLYRMTWAAA